MAGVARATVLAALLCVFVAPLRALTVETLTSLGGLPPHIVGLFEEAAAFQRIPSGESFVFDRKGHSVYRITADGREARRVLEIGQEPGRVLNPSAFDLMADGSFAVADAPAGRERVQLFGPAGIRVGGFTLPGRLGARVAIGGTVLNGVGSLQFTGRTFLISEPEHGSLFIEYSTSGAGVRSIGNLRPTGFERDRDLHVALNAGLPLVDPLGGYYFVFLSGTPTFRKYDARGELVFERRVEGRELDPLIGSLPTSWPTRRVQDREVPFVTPTVRAAAVEPSGHLWISLAVPYTYVYDPTGDKTRTLQFLGAGVLSPTSLFFTQTRRLLVTPGCYEFDAS
jgi:hypothetical protein